MYMRDKGVFLSKWPHDWRIILSKEQLGHSYIFWTILIFCQFANLGNQSLVLTGLECTTDVKAYCSNIYRYCDSCGINSFFDS